MKEFYKKITKIIDYQKIACYIENAVQIQQRIYIISFILQQDGFFNTKIFFNQAVFELIFKNNLTETDQYRLISTFQSVKEVVINVHMTFNHC